MATTSKPWWETWRLTAAGFDITNDLSPDELAIIKKVVEAVYNRKWKAQAFSR
jgi:hypothetical protein